MKDFIRSVSLPDDGAAWITAELERERDESHGEEHSRISALNAQIQVLDEKIARLTTAFLEQALTLPEYRDLKNSLIEDKQRIKDRLASGEALESWFEPALRFVEASKQAIRKAESHDLEEIRNFIQETGSNLHLTDKKLSLTPRDEWQTVATHRSFFTTPVFGTFRGAELVAATRENDNFDEWRRGWDSNPRLVAQQRFSRPPRSTTLPPLRCERLFNPPGHGSSRRNARARRCIFSDIFTAKSGRTAGCVV